jgi:hypothetical protein
MKQEILTRFPWPWLPSMALLIFFVFFLGLIVRLTMKSHAPVLQRAQTLPLEDGEIYEQ